MMYSWMKACESRLERRVFISNFLLMSDLDHIIEFQEELILSPLVQCTTKGIKFLSSTMAKCRRITRVTNSKVLSSD